MLTRYEIRAPLDGVVIEKHLVLGEAIKEDTAIFMIADLSTVWGEFSVYAKDLNAVRLGQEVTVKSEVLALEATATVSYLGPLVGEETRSASAHVHIREPGRALAAGPLRDGGGRARRSRRCRSPSRPRRSRPTAIGRWCLRNYGDVFEVRPLELGRRDGQWVEVVKGLSAGERYAATNSFVLKAELGKSGASHEH